MALTRVKLKNLILGKEKFIQYIKTEKDITFRECLIEISNIQLRTMIELYSSNYKLTNKEKAELLDIENECAKPIYKSEFL